MQNKTQSHRSPERRWCKVTNRPRNATWKDNASGGGFFTKGKQVRVKSSNLTLGLGNSVRMPWAAEDRTYSKDVSWADFHPRQKREGTLFHRSRSPGAWQALSSGTSSRFLLQDDGLTVTSAMSFQGWVFVTGWMVGCLPLKDMSKS